MKKVLFLFQFLTITFPIFCQNIQTYSGVMLGPRNASEVNQKWTYKGRGQYQYYLDDKGNRVKHGDFNFSYIAGNDVLIYKVVGKYINGKKEGIWQFSKDVCTISGRYRPQYSISYFYENDLREGNFEYYRYEVFENICIKGECKNDKLEGAIDITIVSNDNGESGHITGFLSEGYADGLWTISRETQTSLPVTQYRSYFNGILLRLREWDESSGNNKVIYEDPLFSIQKNLSIKTDFMGESFLCVDDKEMKLKDNNYDKYVLNVNRNFNTIHKIFLEDEGFLGFGTILRELK